MPYELVAEKVRALPAQAVEEVIHYIDYIAARYAGKPKEEKDTAFIDAMQGILSHEDVESIRGTCRLRFRDA